MCYHKSLVATHEQLMEHYSASFEALDPSNEIRRYHENGFDFMPSPVVTVGKPHLLLNFNWGLIPFWAKSLPAAERLRLQTLNCIAEEMYEKPAFKDAAKNNQRCLIPCTGFYEWRWLDDKGKTKIPYYVRLKHQEIFSLAGLYSRWRNPETDETTYTFTILTTHANSLMATIHNSKRRMPVIVPREYEKDWISSTLTKDDVLALCQPIDDTRMGAYTISKRISSRTEETNVPEVLAPMKWKELEPAAKQPSLFPPQQTSLF